MQPCVHIVGAGLAGTEAAWQAARSGIPVVLYEMRPSRFTPAHKTDQMAELVCSNSLKSESRDTAPWLLKEELRRLDSLAMRAASVARIPGGHALTVDREIFSSQITAHIGNCTGITVRREEIRSVPRDRIVVIASGPLTSDDLAADIARLTGTGRLYFYDSISPIVDAESIDMSIAFRASRYGKSIDGTEDYINCPLNKEQYQAFVQALIDGEKTEFKDWEKDTPYFEGCLPIEVMAERGIDTLRHGPMKPVGLDDPRTGRWPYAVVQLRQDNALGTLYNLVGFQTKLKHGAQVEIFRMIPGLEKAEFARLGGLHRNTFLNSPKLLDRTLRLTSRPHIRFAGQITGCEGYIESAAVGLLAGRFALADRAGIEPSIPPDTTALGALLAHITGGASAETFQPMNVNFGLFPPIEGRHKGRERKRAYAIRARSDLEGWLAAGRMAAE